MPRRCLVLLLAVGCSSPIHAPANLGSLCSAPSASTGQVSDVRSGDESLALTLLANQADGGSNLALSPFSISLALDLAYAGAATSTASQMAAVLGLGSAASDPGPAMASLSCEVEGDASEAGNQLEIANALFGQQGVAFEDAFLNVLRTDYGAPLQSVSFDDASSAVGTINGWVSNQTDGMIPSLLSSDDVSSSTRLVLVNALHFKGTWQSGFDASKTTSQPFATGPSTFVSVPMMTQSSQGRFGYFHGDGVAIAELPYQGQKLALDVILPDAASGEHPSPQAAASPLSSLVASLTVAQLQGWLSQLSTTQLAPLSVPRFSIDSHVELASALSAIGMPLPFESGAADFSGMDGEHDLYLQHVVHEAVVEVDESGTTAAAATAVTVTAASVAVQPPTFPSFVADRPFLFLLRDLGSGTLLFVGQVTNPAG